MDNFTKNIKNWPSEQIKILLLFLEQERKTITYEEIATQLGFKASEIDDKTGKSIGGILSTLRRNKINNEPLISSLGRILGTRRIQWRLNNKAFPIDARTETIGVINEILKERNM